MNALDPQKATVRQLAARVAEIAASAENARIQQRWRDVNALRKPDRAPVWCRPVGAWAEQSVILICAGLAGCYGQMNGYCRRHHGRPAVGQKPFQPLLSSASASGA